jgi:hypothetical protein
MRPVSPLPIHEFDQSSGRKGALYAVLGAFALVACSGESPGAHGAGGAAGMLSAAGGMAGVAAVGTGGSGTGGPPAGGAGAGTAGTTGSGGVAIGAGGGSAGSANGGNANGVGGSAIGGVGGMPASGGAPTGGAGPMPGAGGAGGSASTLTDADTLIPHGSWTCGMPDGIPPPTTGELVFEATAQLGEIYDLGQTQYGHRFQTEIKGGTVTGPKINGTLMDRGLDYELDLSNGAVELEEINILKTSDGASIYLRSCGTAPGPSASVRIVPDFEAPNGGPYAFLNTGKLVGTRELDKAKKTLKFSVYSVTAAAPAHTVAVVEPDGVPDQTWECKKAAGTKGAVVYTESVGIGAGSVAVGASKRGTRNIIPITGGTTSGRITGTVLSGGADYQIIGTTFELDARYTIHTNDGELIIVRNCGPVGALVPVFEAATAGKYAFMNANTWLSSDPGVGAGVVNLTIYEGGR